MTMQVDRDKPLDDETRAWLLTRGVEGERIIAEVDAKFPPENDLESVSVDGDGDDDVPPYSDWIATDLAAECTRRGLPKSGTKPDLVARLEQYDRDNP